MKTSSKFYGWVILGMVGATSSGVRASSDTESATATITIIESIDLVKNLDLRFPQASRGESAATVAPGDSEAATFSVSGAPSTNITTSIDQSSIEMIIGLGDTDETRIVVNNFQHNAPTQLDALGTASFGVGATRAAILSNQATGAYQGTFNVTVSYQ
jgi:hypothetical protein